MEVIDFKKLYEYDFNIYDIIAKRQHWKNGQKFCYATPRAQHGFLYLNACTATVTSSDNSVICAHSGEFIYLPKGIVYNVAFSDCADDTVNSYTVSFSLNNSLGEEIAFSDTVKVFCGPPAVREKMPEAASLYEQLHCCPSQLKICLYSICKAVSAAENKFLPKDYRIIKNGIDYIHRCVDDNPNIDTAAKMCSVSASYFRRVFKNYNGCTPKEYILNKKIEKAKEMLRSELYTVSEISDILQFSTPAYFTVIFKKKTGFTPSQYSHL